LPIVGAAAFLLTAASPLGATQTAGGPAAGESSSLTLHRASGLLAGRVPAGSSIADIAIRIGDLAGIDIEIRGDPGTLRHSVSLDGLDIEAALKRVAPNHSLVIAYVPRKPGSQGAISGSAGRAIQKIVLGSGTPIEQLPTPAPADPAEAPDPDVARAIAEREIVKLSYAADRAAIDRLRETAVRAGDPSERRAAMSALAGIGGQSLNLFALFVDTGLVDPDPGVRMEAVRSIMRVMGERGRTIVEAAARREDDPAVRNTMQRLARGESVERDAPPSPVHLTR
jgi:hypothetical protein